MAHQTQVDTEAWRLPWPGPASTRQSWDSNPWLSDSGTWAPGLDTLSPWKDSGEPSSRETATHPWGGARHKAFLCPTATTHKQK